MRRLAFIASVVLVVAGCNASLARRSSMVSAPPERTASYGSVAPATPGPSTIEGVKAPHVGGGTIVVRVTDQNGGHPAGIPIRTESDAGAGTSLSDVKGELVMQGSPGKYTFRVVEGCRETVDVRSGGYATVALNEGDRKTAILPVTWRHRIAPAPPVFTDPAGNVRVGGRADVIFDVIDRCAKARARSGAFPTYRFHPSSGVEIVGTPVLRADGGAHGSVTVRCTAAGRLGLVITDEDNRSDSIDLMREYSGYGAGPRCVTS